jgi:hypothetical protein
MNAIISLSRSGKSFIIHLFPLFSAPETVERCSAGDRLETFNLSLAGTLPIDRWPSKGA